MAEEEKQRTDSPVKPGLSRGAMALGGVAVVALAAVVYGIIAVGGKETASASCGVTEANLAPLRAAASGEVAGLTVSKAPKPATEIAFDGPDGQRRSLADFKGKTILVNLWATWCLPCRAEMPALDQLQSKLGGPDFEVVAVNIDTARLEKRQAFLDEAGVKALAFYTDPKAGVFQTLRQAGKVVGLPTTLLIDARGCELGVMAGPAEWASEDAFRLIRAATALKPGT